MRKESPPIIDNWIIQVTKKGADTTEMTIRVVPVTSTNNDKEKVS